jgi:hypothetical protein
MNYNVYGWVLFFFALSRISSPVSKISRFTAIVTKVSKVVKVSHLEIKESL